MDLDYLSKGFLLWAPRFLERAETNIFLIHQKPAAARQTKSRASFEYNHVAIAVARQPFDRSKPLMFVQFACKYLLCSTLSQRHE